MASQSARPWRWPSLDEVAAPRRSFEPVPCAALRCVPGTESEEAEQMIAERRRQADHLLAEARDEAETIRREARAQAIEEAAARLEEALQGCIAEQVEAFAQARAAILERIEAAAEEHIERLERELAGLIASMAQKVIRRKVDEDDGVVLDVVRATVAQAAGARRITVRVPAAGEQRVRAAQAELLAATEGADELAVVADPAIGSGGCIVETERGRFDARIGTQIDLLTEELGRVLGGGEGG
jgi:flagellar biosynthesis/type III secretory pathway protein FliH